MKYYLVGIKGSGMAALAHILLDKENDIRGSDVDSYVMVEDDLRKRNIIIDDLNCEINNVDIVIVGHSFINHKQVLDALEKGIKIIEYNDYLASIVNNCDSIAVCGSHGKTTTVGMLKTCFNDASYLIGDGSGKYNKDSNSFIFEACEYQNHFLKYYPKDIVLLNIDYDHVDYFKSFDDYINSFNEFLGHSRGKVYINGDDKNINIKEGYITFGKNKNNKYQARNIDGVSFDFYCYDEFICHINTKFYGDFMIYNCLACLSVMMENNTLIEDFNLLLNQFDGVKRRFVETIVNDDIYIDDYAHHPSQMKMMIDTIKSKYSDKDIVAIYKPDRYSRLEKFNKSIARILSSVKQGYIVPFKKGTIKDSKDDIDIDIIANQYENLKVLNDDFDYNEFKEYENIVFLFMSSKDMSNIITNIRKIRMG